MTIEMRLCYAGLPPVKSKRLGEKSVALARRALFVQENERKMRELKEIAEGLDYKALDILAEQFHTTPSSILLSYFSSLGLRKEYLVMTVEEGAEIIRVVAK